MRISIVATVKNEADSVDHLLQSILEQARRPDEVIIVDGGSSDDTLDKLRIWEASRRLPLHVLEEPGCNISKGRNTAIAAATGTVVAVTDAGVRLDKHWLAELMQVFESSRQPPTSVIACGFFIPETHSTFEVAMAATVLPALQDIRPATFLPSSRSVAYHKDAWQASGGYPDWLDYCEDLVFDLRLRALGYQMRFVPKAIVYFRPRSSLGSFFRQYYRYARGDGKAGLWPKRHAARYVTYLGALPLSVTMAIAQDMRWLMLLPIGAIIMLWTPYKRLWSMRGDLGLVQRLQAVFLVPLIRVIGDIAKMVGYPVGLWWRFRNRALVPDWHAAQD